MKCDWNGLLAVLPLHLRQEVDRQGREKLQELRLRMGCPVEMILGGTSCFLEKTATLEDIRFVVNTASKYSPWAASTAANGYITAPGGHRIGMCGECVVQSGGITGIRTATSLCIRVARDFEGIGEKLPNTGSLLILGPPGAGKTTLLRDLIRQRARWGKAVSVVDERGELFPDGFAKGARTDVLTGCSKADGIPMVLRSMSPECIAVDEITATEDCNGLLHALWCGVELLATAHAANQKDLFTRPVYRPLAESGVFSTVVILSKDKSWRMERMEICT